MCCPNPALPTPDPFYLLVKQEQGKSEREKEGEGACSNKTRRKEVAVEAVAMLYAKQLFFQFRGARTRILGVVGGGVSGLTKTCLGGECKRRRRKWGRGEKATWKKEMKGKWPGGAGWVLPGRKRGWPEGMCVCV